jgi:dTDP-4-amino-4,6-dideoxygalactose transaminase
MTYSIPYTRLRDQYDEAKTDIDEAIKYCIENNYFITGKTTEEFEEVFAETVGSPCASTGSGSTALLCSLLACDIGIGDTVITTPHSFVSTSEAILQTGATPIFVDVDDNYLIDVDKIEEAIEKTTKAILFVDLYGQTPDIDKLNTIASEHGLYLIEDAAQSFGATYKNKKVGELADLTCFSFNPVKTLGAMGDAGAITGRSDLITKAKQYRDHGRTNKWVSNFMGYNARIDCIQARIVQAKLKYIDAWITGRQSICKMYSNHIDKNKFIVPKICADNTHVFYAYVIQVLRDREKFIKYMEDNNIACNVHYRIPINQQPGYKDFTGADRCPKSDALNSKIVSIPCYHSLTIGEINYILLTINSFKYEIQ